MEPLRWAQSERQEAQEPEAQEPEAQEPEAQEPEAQSLPGRVAKARLVVQYPKEWVRRAVQASPAIAGRMAVFLVAVSLGAVLLGIAHWEAEQGVNTQH